MKNFLYQFYHIKMLLLLTLMLLVNQAWTKWTKQMENPKLFGGDMVMTPMEIEALVNGTNAYGSIIGGRWPNGIVPYVIDRSIGSQGRWAIQAAINDYHKYTCVKWKQRTNERIYAKFFSGDGCSSPVGYRRWWSNDISLGRGCQDKGTAIHEMGHTIGLYHEQNRPDRDKYVRINRNQIMSGMYYNFQIERNIDSLGTPYDLKSIMHYGSTAFARGPYYTIETRDKSKQYLINHGDRVNDFSEIDIQQINLMYKCGNVKPPTPPPGGCVNTDNRCDGWAAGGYCNSDNDEYLRIMKQKCCKACGGKFNPPTKSPNCVDIDEECVRWAKNGYCTAVQQKHLDIMRNKCCKSCKEPYAKCENLDTQCDSWANRGECDKNPNYMWRNCPKSCNLCK